MESFFRSSHTNAFEFVSTSQNVLASTLQILVLKYKYNIKHATIYLVQSMLNFIQKQSIMYLYFYSFIMFDLNST